MRETESSLQQFAEFVLKARLVTESAAPYIVRWVRLFLRAPASEGSLAERARRFCDDLERNGSQDWQVRQAEQALRLYFVNFLNAETGIANQRRRGRRGRERSHRSPQLSGSDKPSGHDTTRIAPKSATWTG